MEHIGLLHHVGYVEIQSALGHRALRSDIYELVLLYTKLLFHKGHPRAFDESPDEEDPPFEELSDDRP